MTTLHLRKPIDRPPLRLALLLIPLAIALASFALSPTARAADGGVGDGSSTAEGGSALGSLTTGTDNTAIGTSALRSLTTGSFNTANGFQALFNNTTGSDNTAAGLGALGSNTTGSDNTATGEGALAANTTGNNNTASGFQALYTNDSGHDNTAEGFHALGINTGSSNIGLGSGAGINLTTGSNNIDIANGGLTGEANTIRIGKASTQKATFIAGISGVAVSGSTVVVNSSGKLGVATSSAQFKEAIKPMDKASEAILALKPVTFRYKHELDPEGIPQFGLVAEGVEKVNPDLVARDADGKVNTVRYEAVNTMLLNEFLKEHRKVEEQEATITQLKKGMEAVTARLKEQDTKIQAVNERLERATPWQVVDRE